MSGKFEKMFQFDYQDFLKFSGHYFHFMLEKLRNFMSKIKPSTWSGSYSVICENQRLYDNNAIVDHNFGITFSNRRKLDQPQNADSQFRRQITSNKSNVL